MPMVMGCWKCLWLYYNSWWISMICSAKFLGSLHWHWGNRMIAPVPLKWPMMTSSNGKIFRVTGPLCGEFTGPGEFPTQRPVTRSFDVFFDLRLNKRLSKQPWGWWFETPSWSLWRHRNAKRVRYVLMSVNSPWRVWYYCPSINKLTLKDMGKINQYLTTRKYNKYEKRAYFLGALCLYSCVQNIEPLQYRRMKNVWYWYHVIVIFILWMSWSRADNCQYRRWMHAWILSKQKCGGSFYLSITYWLNWCMINAIWD